MKSRTRSRSRLILSTALAGGLLLPALAAAQTPNGTLPNASDANVALGTATITGGGPTPGSTLDVSLASGTTVIDWFHFDVPAGDTARFTNNAAVPVAAVLNRVRAGGPVAVAAPSNLAGTITAPGVELWIQNGEGFLFGSNLSITSAGFLASVGDISLTDFTAGGGFRAVTSADSTAGIRGGGAGTRILTNGGKLALIAPVIDVTGTFDAGTGSVAFVTATDVSMTMAAGSPLAITVNRGTSVGGASQIVAGSVAGKEAYFVLASASSVVDSLLDVRAATRATGAVATGRGVVLVAGEVSGAPGVSFSGGGGANSGIAGIAVSGTLDATGAGQEVALRASRDIAATAALTASGGISAEAGGALALTRATAGTGITLKAGGAVTATGLLDTAVGALDVTGAALTLDDLTARAGSVKLTGTAVRADDIVAGTTVQATAGTGAVALGSIAAGGDIALAGAPDQAVGVARAITSTGGGLAIDGAGAVRLASADVRDAITIGAATAPASIEATGLVRGNSIDARAGGNVTLADATSATVVTLASGGALRTGTLNAAAGGITGTAATIDIAGATSRDGALSLTATGASLRLGTSSVRTGATLTAAAGDIAVGSLTSATGDVTVSGRSLAGTTAPGATLEATAGAVEVTTTGSVALASATAGTGLTVASGATLRIDDTARANGAIALTAPGAIALGTVVSTGGPVTVTGGAAITGTGSAGGDISAAGALAVTAAGAITLDALAGNTVTVAGPSLSVGSATARAGDAVLTASAGDATLGDGSATRDLLVTASGVAAVRGTVEAGRDYRVQGASVRLGDGPGSEIQRAARFAAITATTGGIAGNGGLTLIGDGAGVGIGNAVTLDAANGAISLPGSVLRGGTARQSDVALRFAAGTPLVVGDVIARAFGRTDAGGAAVVPIAHNAAVTVGNLDLASSLALSTSAGGLTTGNIASTGSVTLAADALVTGDVTAATTIAATATGAVAGQRLRSTGGTTVSGGSVQLVEASAGAGAVDVRATAGRLDIGTASGTGVALETSGGGTAAKLSAGTVTATAGPITLRSVGDIDIGTATATGTIDVTAAGAVGRGSGPGNLTSTGGDVGVTAGGAATLAEIAGNAVTARAASLDVGAVTARSGDLTLFATGGALVVGPVVGGAVSLSGLSLTAGDITARSGPAVLTARLTDLSVGRVSAAGPVTVAAGRDIAVAGVTTGAGDARLTANGGIVLGGSSSVNGKLVISGRAVTLGSPGGASQTIAINGAIDITARTGDIVGLAGLTLLSDAGGAGGHHMFLDASNGSINFALDTVLKGGPDRQSSIGFRVGRTGSIDIGGASGDIVGGFDPARSFFTGLSAQNFRAAGQIRSRQGFSLSAQNTGVVSLADLIVTNPNAEIAITGSNHALTIGTLSSLGRIGVSSSGAVSVGTARSASSSVTLRGQSLVVDSVASGTALDLATFGGNLRVATATAGGDASASGGAGVDITSSLTASGRVSVRSGGTATINSVASTGGRVEIEAESANVARATAAEALLVSTRSGPLSVGTATAGGLVGLSSGGSLTVSGLLSGRTGARASAVGDATLSSIESAAGFVEVTAASATIGRASAAGALTVTSRSGLLSLGDATGNEVSLTSAGGLTVAGSATGTIGVLVNAAGAVSLGTIRSTSGLVGINAASVTANTASAATSLAVDARSGAIALGTGTAGTTARLTATGDVTASTGLTSGGSATISGANLRLATVSATNGAVVATATGEVTGVGTGRANLSAGGAASDATVTAGGAVRLDTVTAGRNVTARGTAIDATTATATAGALDLNATAGALALGTGTAGTTATLRSTGAMTVGTLNSRGATLQSGGTLAATTVNSTADIAATATGAATLGTLTATGAISASGNGVTATRFAAGTTLGVTSGGAVSIGSATAGGAATIDAAGAATLGAMTAGPSLSVRATDATITGVQRATAVTFTNRTPATTALRLGDTTTADGFRLSQAEIGLVEADRLTLDGGSGAVEIGALAFGANSGRTNVDVLTTGRIDVRGTVTGAGSGRLFRFGGTAANLTDRASDIRIAATANGGGRLLFSTADLELRGTRIALGQSAGFLDALTGLSPTEVTSRFVSNAGSSLYAANQGGVAYDPAAATTLSANRLTVRFTDYALFQNTGLLGENSGAVIGASGGPALNFIANGDTGGAGALAIFGTVGGVGGIATALLGPSAIGATSVDLRAARVNGCLLGSGAGCLSNVVSQPILSIFDASRTQILRASDNLSVPFDPVVGTNNEALFSGVSSIDAPPEDVAPPNCPEGSTDPACPRKENNQ